MIKTIPLLLLFLIGAVHGRTIETVNRSIGRITFAIPDNAFPLSDYEIDQRVKSGNTWVIRAGGYKIEDSALLEMVVLHLVGTHPSGVPEIRPNGPVTTTHANGQSIITGSVTLSGNGYTLQVQRTYASFGGARDLSQYRDSILSSDYSALRVTAFEKAGLFGRFSAFLLWSPLRFFLIVLFLLGAAALAVKNLRNRPKSEFAPDEL